MKKVFSLVLAVMLLASLSVVAFADLNRSVSTKAAPNFDRNSIAVEGADVKSVSLKLISAGSKVSANATDEEKAEYAENQTAVQNAISLFADQAAIERAVKETVEVASAKEKSDIYDKAEDAVPSVSDIFYFDPKDESGKSILPRVYDEGENLAVKLTLKIDLPDHLLKVIELVDSTWIEVPVVLDENGDSVLEFSYAGVVAFVYNSNVEKG